MDGPGWKTARLGEIPSRSELPGASAEEYLEGMREAGAAHPRARADARRRFRGDNRKTHDVRGALGIESFGANGFEAHEGELLVIPHDELGEGERNEELYLVIEGRARFVVDGEELELGPGELLFARPGVKREAVALETPTMLFIASGRPGEAYAPPIWASDWRG